MAEDGFFSRWSRRKAQVARGEQPPEPPPEVKSSVRAEPFDKLRTGSVEAPLPDQAAGLSTSPGRTDNVPAAPAEPPPTLEDVAKLGRDSDYSRFVAPDVAPDVKNAALRKLFADPHFNVMDGLDIYIDDYGKPDPLPPGMLRQLAQSKLLGLFDDEDEEKNKPEDGAGAPAAAAAAPEEAPPAAEPALPPDTAAVASRPLLTEPEVHENADLQLQPDDAAGRPGPGQGPAAG
ncbi:DUF3306 domain-containing protein [Azohydromonas caseinilytica]|uniref:DUF3306 domain-containing protein n=1 Tax=Azohydromonas caseinilytica TaxID=2728836 RepID=A0A848F5S9_9BURK|nr:DUF3306 domain-containing protein [Azohydromonas caseinilytica]NML14016.1 DUF3306 domain-containing protein [Azohydromonas caseinilytica]